MIDFYSELTKEIEYREVLSKVCEFLGSRTEKAKIDGLLRGLRLARDIYKVTEQSRHREGQLVVYGDSDSAGVYLNGTGPYKFGWMSY